MKIGWRRKYGPDAWTGNWSTYHSNISRYGELNSEIQLTPIQQEVARSDGGGIRVYLVPRMEGRVLDWSNHMTARIKATNRQFRQGLWATSLQTDCLPTSNDRIGVMTATRSDACFENAVRQAVTFDAYFVAFMVGRGIGPMGFVTFSIRTRLESRQQESEIEVIIHCVWLDSQHRGQLKSKLLVPAVTEAAELYFDEIPGPTRFDEIAVVGEAVSCSGGYFINACAEKIREKIKPTNEIGLWTFSRVATGLRR